MCLKLLIQKCLTYVLRCSFIKTWSLTVDKRFVVLNGIAFNRSNGLITKMFKSMFDELKKVKYFKEITDFKESFNAKYFKEIKRLRSLPKAEAYSEPKRASAMELFL